MIPRKLAAHVRRLARQFPAVLILGPRQCGKTTLARNFIKGQYFDLERPSDLQVFTGDIELALRRFRGPLIIDEAQTLPALFPVLRALIDEERRRNGRYILLGSVSPVLVRSISESLAGRVGMVELTPFQMAEARRAKVGLLDHWLRGGFPEACLERDARRRESWQENYLRTFVERDLPLHGARSSPIEMRRLVTMIAHLSGGLLNLSDLGRSLGVTYHTVNDRLDLIEGHYLVRRLVPFHANIGKRLVKAPKVYLRDSGLLHHVLGISAEPQLLGSPHRGRSWEGFIIEQIIARSSLESPSSQYYFHRTHSGEEVDLIVDSGRERAGYEVKCSLSLNPSDLVPLTKALTDGIVDRGFVVYMGHRRYQPVGGITVLPAALLGMASAFPPASGPD